MTRPIAANIGVSFPYGVKYKNGVIHKGVDFSDGHEGHAVLSCLDGVVSHAGYGGWGPAYGQHVIVRSTFKGKTKWVLYGHMLALSVKAGAKVKAGDHLGLSGGAAGKRYSGNSTGPHVHVQVGHDNNYLAYEDPWAVINSGPTTPTKPAKKPDDWFGIDLRNLAGFDVHHGAATIRQRIPAIVKDIHKVNREVVCVLELPNPEVDYFAAQMKAVGYKHITGDLGRHIFQLGGRKSGASKLFYLTPRLNKDTKQGVGAVLFPNGSHPVAVCTAQLENEDASGKTQVGQATNLIDKFEAFCDDHDIDSLRRFYALDTNSDNLVRALFEKHGYVDAFDVAYSSENNVFRTIVKWFGKATKGKRIDLIAVPKGRPVLRARVRTGTSDLSDHLDSFVDVGSID